MDKPQNPVSNFTRAKRKYHFRLAARKLLADYILIVIATLCAGFGLRGFLLPNNFIDGGAVGVSLLTAEVTGWPLSIILVVVNIPFILIGLRIISPDFTVKTFFGIMLLALLVAWFPYPQITSDKLLVAIFGGFFLGAGIGLAVRGGGVIDGTEVLAVGLSRKFRLTIGDIILFINIIIFSVAAYLLSVETALYSLLTYFVASKTVDFIIEGIEEYTGVTIISVKPEEIRDMITEKIGRGVTIYNGKRGYGKSGFSDREIDIIFTVVTRLEVNRLNLEIEKIDPNAFVVMHRIKDTKGGMIKKRRLRH